MHTFVEEIEVGFNLEVVMRDASGVIEKTPADNSSFQSLAERLRRLPGLFIADVGEGFWGAMEQKTGLTSF